MKYLLLLGFLGVASANQFTCDNADSASEVTNSESTGLCAQGFTLASGTQIGSCTTSGFGNGYDMDTCLESQSLNTAAQYAGFSDNMDYIVSICCIPPPPFTCQKADSALDLLLCDQGYTVDSETQIGPCTSTGDDTTDLNACFNSQELTDLSVGYDNPYVYIREICCIPPPPFTCEKADSAFGRLLCDQGYTVDNETQIGPCTSTGDNTLDLNACFNSQELSDLSVDYDNPNMYVQDLCCIPPATPMTCQSVDNEFFTNDDELCFSNTNEFNFSAADVQIGNCTSSLGYFLPDVDVPDSVNNNCLQTLPGENDDVRIEYIQNLCCMPSVPTYVLIGHNTSCEAGGYISLTQSQCEDYHSRYHATEDFYYSVSSSNMYDTALHMSACSVKESDGRMWWNRNTNGIACDSDDRYACVCLDPSSSGESPSGPLDSDGVCGGTADVDDCGVCAGGDTGLVANQQQNGHVMCTGSGTTERKKCGEGKGVVDLGVAYNVDYTCEDCDVADRKYSNETDWTTCKQHTECDAGQGSTELNSQGINICTDCEAGTNYSPSSGYGACLDVANPCDTSFQYESQAPTKILNRRCDTKVCSTCENGNGAEGAACSVHEGPDCESCNGPYSLYDELCYANSADSDSDGVTNLREITDGTSPLNDQSFKECSRLDEVEDASGYINEQCCNC